MLPEKPPGGEVPKGFRLIVAGAVVALLIHWFW